jgi:hypothetical protein
VWRSFSCYRQIHNARRIAIESSVSLGEQRGADIHDEHCPAKKNMPGTRPGMCIQVGLEAGVI